VGLSRHARGCGKSQVDDVRAWSKRCPGCVRFRVESAVLPAPQLPPTWHRGSDVRGTAVSSVDARHCFQSVLGWVWMHCWNELCGVSGQPSLRALYLFMWHVMSKKAMLFAWLPSLSPSLAVVSADMSLRFPSSIFFVGNRLTAQPVACLTEWNHPSLMNIFFLV
jgi:hypothetical protein